MSEAAGSRRPETTGAGIWLVLVSASAYGFNVPFARLAHEAGLAAPVSALLRALVLFALALVYVRLTRTDLSVPRQARLPVFFLGLTTGLLSLGYFGAVVFIPVSLAAIVFFTFPVLILAISVLRGDTRAGPGEWAVFATVFVGLVLVIGPETGGLDWRGVALAALTSLSAVGQFFAAYAVGRHLDARPAVLWSHVVVLPVLGVGLAVSGVEVRPAGAGAWAAAGVVCLAYVVAYTSQVLALRSVAPARAGLYFNVEPVVTVGAAMLLLGERLGPLQILGAAMVLGALVRSSMADRRSAGQALRTTKR